MIFEALLIGLFFILITKRRINDDISFSKVSLYCLLVGILLNICMMVFTKIDFGYLTYIFIEYYFYFHVISLILIALGMILNYKNPGLLIVGLGFILNVIPILFNKKMPVSESDLLKTADVYKYNLIAQGRSLSHGIFEDPIMYILSDIIPISTPYPMAKVISVGDIVISIGIVIYIFYISRRKV
ncbi:putative membrane protein [Peptoniphilus sp. ING2-D1G]|nr:putative membrane protein [Peptoniphilus sp. ING2-D1G]